jgi:hypothetical protein
MAQPRAPLVIAIVIAIAIGKERRTDPNVSAMEVAMVMVAAMVPVAVMVTTMMPVAVMVPTAANGRDDRRRGLAELGLDPRERRRWGRHQRR